MDKSNGPIFTAVSSSARQLFVLLRCVGFASKAQVQITAEGLRFSAEEARVMQGLAFLDKALFTSFTFNPPTTNSHDGSEDDGSEASLTPTFQISLSALLETLQIFGINDLSNSTINSSRNRTNYTSSAFTTPALNLGGTCRLTYADVGAPLSITLTEAGVTTTCDLTTYEPTYPPNNDDDGEDIPLQRDALTMKIIMRSTWLSDAIAELSSTNPTTLTLSASATTAPFFALSASGGPFGDSSVEFNPSSTPKDSNNNNALDQLGTGRRTNQAPMVTETFQVNAPTGSRRVKQRYKFDLIKKASRAMTAASKVSIRGDRNGVMSLQFMIEFGEGIAMRDGRAGVGEGNLVPGAVAGGKVSFVDFRFVPLIDDEDEDVDEGEDEDQRAE